MYCHPNLCTYIWSNVRALYWGDKRSLAMAVCDVWTEVAITAENLYMELSLICPGWFSAMLSQRYEERMRLRAFFNKNIWRMLSRCSRSYEKVGDLADLKSRFESLSLSNDITQLLALDSFIHRLIGEWETIKWTNCWLMTLILFQASSKFTQFSEPIGTFSKIPCRNSECSRVWINWRRVVQRRKCSDSMMSF